MAGRRALHWVFKVGDRKETMRFYREVLGMQVLRHEEFTEGCLAACNGPYDGRWSKTMVGYGPEDSHFVVELTYNYNISQYKQGNDFQGITVQSSEALARARTMGWPVEEAGGRSTVRAPGGYPFHLLDLPQPPSDPVLSVAISCSSTSASLAFWCGGLGLLPSAATASTTCLSYPSSTSLVLVGTGGAAVEHHKAGGRLAFACPAGELAGLEEKARAGWGEQAVLTSLVSLDTPGKATVQVVILADPDGQEICFVGGEAFQELSQVDPKAVELLEAALEEDRSVEWFARKGRSKVEEA